MPFRTQLFEIYLLSALPKIMSGIRTSLGFALLMMIITEFYAASDGKATGFGENGAIAKAISSGKIVLSIDVRGCGETAGSAGGSYGGCHVIPITRPCSACT